MNKGRFLNQKLGKRASRKIALLKSNLAVKNRIQDSGFRVPDGKSRIQDSGFRIRGAKQH
jgi:hypothetical protein